MRNLYYGLVLSISSKYAQDNVHTVYNYMIRKTFHFDHSDFSLFYKKKFISFFYKKVYITRTQEK
jgi:hypothetical protein